jgi:TatD DNase family protein
MTDAHCHLQNPAFAADLDQVLQRSRAAGVTRWVVNGTCPADWPRVAELADTLEGVLPQFGLHPWHADESSDWMPLLESYLERYPQAGVGEIGLDAKLTPIPLPQQLRAFRFQLRLAKRLQRPCTIHAVGVYPTLRTVLREEKPENVLLHAFGGSPQQVKDFTALGASFSFGGALLRSPARNEALCAVPPGRLHLESDAPFQHPLGKSHRMEPAQLADILLRVRLLGIDL